MKKVKKLVLFAIVAVIFSCGEKSEKKTEQKVKESTKKHVKQQKVKKKTKHPNVVNKKKSISLNEGKVEFDGMEEGMQSAVE